MPATPKSETRSPKCVVLGITGSIAAYKSAELVSLLVKQAHNVFVVMTRDAVEFILKAQGKWKSVLEEYIGGKKSKEKV